MVGRERIHQTANSGSFAGKIIRQDERVGRVIGRLTLLSRAENDKHGKTRWNCICSCGNTCVVGWAELRRGDAHSCGCLAKEVSAARQKYNLVGEVFGRLKVIQKKTNALGNHVKWACLCRCGTLIDLKTQDLVGSRYTSCGCLKYENNRKDDRDVATHLLFKRYKQNAERTKKSWELTFSQFRELVLSSCFYCGQFTKKTLARKTRKLDTAYSGVDRKDSSLGYTVENSVSCCSMCNKMKMEFPLDSWKDQIRRIYDHLELGRSDS